MAKHITWDGSNPKIAEIEPPKHRRNATRIAPDWRVMIRLESGMHVSAAIADLSFKAFRSAIPEFLEIGSKVQFLISENSKEYLDGHALKGEAVVTLRHRRGTIFEFQEFQENDFNRLCVVVRSYIDDAADQSE